MAGFGGGGEMAKSRITWEGGEIGGNQSLPSSSSLACGDEWLLAH